MIMEKKNVRIGKFFSNCAKNKKIHGSGYCNRYTTAFTPHNRNGVTATITATATAFSNLAYFSKSLSLSHTHQINHFF